MGCRCEKMLVGVIRSAAIFFFFFLLVLGKVLDGREGTAGELLSWYGLIRTRLLNRSYHGA